MSKPATEAERERLERRAQQAAAARRRRVALAAIAAVAGIAGAVIGGLAGDRDGGDQASMRAASKEPSCPAEIAGDPRRLTGQMVIARMEGTATAQLRRLLNRGEIGGVVLFPPPGTDPEALGKQVAALRRAAAGLEPLVMIDQEGGEVKRLPTLPPDRSPPQIAARGDSYALEQGAVTGRALAALGVDVDLAPVLDVPVSSQVPIFARAFAARPAQVAATGSAFASGLARAGVAATAKHFPGLGTSAVNTDLAPTAIPATRAELEPGLVPFRAAIAAGVELVMVSNATYPALDPDRPASLSPRVVEGLLRRRLGYDAVVITDDLGAGAIAGAGIAEGEAAVAAVRAGADLLLFALSDGSEARRALLRALRSGGLDRRGLLASCARTTALRARLAGLGQ